MDICWYIFMHIYMYILLLNKYWVGVSVNEIRVQPLYTNQKTINKKIFVSV